MCRAGVVERHHGGRVLAPVEPAGAQVDAAPRLLPPHPPRRPQVPRGCARGRRGGRRSAAARARGAAPCAASKPAAGGLSGAGACQPPTAPSPPPAATLPTSPGLVVFFVSAVFHEVLVGVPMHMVRLWAFWGLMAQVRAHARGRASGCGAARESTGRRVAWVQGRRAMPRRASAPAPALHSLAALSPAHQTATSPCPALPRPRSRS